MYAPIQVLLVDPAAAEEPCGLLELLETLDVVADVAVERSYESVLTALARKPVEIVVVVLDHDRARGLALVRGAAQEAGALGLIAATRHRDAEVMLQLFRAGAQECLLLPASGAEIESIVAQMRARYAESAAPAGPRAHTVTVVGATGGVGCTSLAVNLAMALQRGGAAAEVALADFDLVSGLVAPWLGLQHETALPHLTLNVARLDHLLLRRAMTRHPDSGVMVLPGLDDITEADLVDADALRQILELMKAAFHAVVIDTGKGLHVTDLAAIQAADTVLFVAQLDVLGLHNSARLLHLLRGLNGVGEKVRVVLNRVGSGASEVRLKTVENALGLPVSWQIPNAFRAFHASRSHGKPLPPGGSGAAAWKAIEAIAHALLPASALSPPSKAARADLARPAGWWPPRTWRRAAVSAAVS